MENKKPDQSDQEKNNKKPDIEKSLQNAMMKFFLKTSAPRILKNKETKES